MPRDKRTFIEDYVLAARSNGDTSQDAKEIIKGAVIVWEEIEKEEPHER